MMCKCRDLINASTVTAKANTNVEKWNTSTWRSLFHLPFLATALEEPQWILQLLQVRSVLPAACSPNAKDSERMFAQVRAYRRRIIQIAAAVVIRESRGSTELAIDSSSSTPDQATEMETVAAFAIASPLSTRPRSSSASTRPRPMRNGSRCAKPRRSCPRAAPVKRAATMTAGVSACTYPADRTDSRGRGSTTARLRKTRHNRDHF